MVFDENQEQEEEEQQLQASARKKLGIPEYDPNASLISVLPKITSPGSI